MKGAFFKALKYYLILSGLLANMVLAVLVYWYALPIYDLRLPSSVIAQRAINRVEGHSPLVAASLDRIFRLVGIVEANTELYGITMGIDPAAPDWKGWGASASTWFDRQAYDVIGKPQVPVRKDAGSAAAIGGGYPDAGTIRSVSTVHELRAAVDTAGPGDRIVLAPGEYRISQALTTGNAGKTGSPITLGARRLGEVHLLVDTQQAFIVQQPYWVFENLELRGVCNDHSTCEHAFHVVANGRGTVIRNNRMLDFNSMIKVNGETVSGNWLYPDYGLIESNSLFNTTLRNTGNPVSLIDIVGANGWLVRNNLLADFGKSGGDRISYGAFAKGNATGTVFESNIIACQLRVPIQKDVRVGLSLGGGGTDSPYCRKGDCSVEHSRGVLRNNIVLHCPNDVGIYLNRSAETGVYNNTLYDTVGIDVRFPASTAVIYNNIVGGRIHDRDDAISIRESNLVVGYRSGNARDEFHTWFYRPEIGDFTLLEGARFVDRGISREGLSYDFCGHNRAGEPVDIGAIEYQDQQPCLPLSR